MAINACFFPLAATGATAFALVAAIFVPTGHIWAADQTIPAPIVAPAAAAAAPANPGAEHVVPALPDIKPAKVVLNEEDEYAALESVQFALTEVADGSSYVWHRAHGRLSGVVKPVSSFKDLRGTVCRHAVVVLSGTDSTKSTEIVACRLATGIWQVES